jgi:RNA polymerase sigma-70 factor (ECF subfamily)
VEVESVPLRDTAPEVNVSDSSFWMTTFEEHGSAVMAFLTSRTGRRDVAEDLLQETFVRAMRARPKLPDPSGVRSYLFTTAHRLLLSRHRRKRPFLFSEASARDSRALEQMADADAASPESAADLSRFEERLRGVLATLKPAHRTAFELAVLQQKAYSEIAREQSWTLAQVKTNVHRSRKQVIAALGDLLGPRLEIRP